MPRKTTTKTTASSPSPSESRFRADVARGLEDASGVDRNSDLIRGYAVISKGMARGHGMEIDDKTLDQVVALGNSRKRLGIKSRFGHPSMSSDALGTFLGRSKNFRRDGDVVRADLHLDPTSHDTPSGDLGRYVIDLAESDPQAFGSSIVFKGEAEKRLEKDGTAQKGKDGKDLPPLARVKELHASDIVDSPAANARGMFATEFFTADCQLSAAASEFLDTFLQKPDAVERVISFLTRYKAETTEDASMGTETSNKETAALEASKDPDGPRTFTEAQLAAAVNAGVNRALSADRTRSRTIREAAFAGQDDLVAKLIDDDSLSADQAILRLIADKKASDAKLLAEVRTDHVPTLGASNDPEPAEAPSTTEPTRYDEVTEKKIWANDAALRAEFNGEEDAYLGFRKAYFRGELRQYPRD